MNRFKIVFNNSATVSPQFNNLGGGLASIGSRPAVSAPPKNMSLNAPMIDRVHKAKPGCSACGKKIA
jgi:hypothetical protein